MSSTTRRAGLAVFAAALTLAGAMYGVARPASAGAAAQLTAPQLVADMGAGWNLGNQLEANTNGIPSETAWGNPVVTQALIDRVKASGFKTIRIPVSYLGNVGAGPQLHDQSGLAQPDRRGRQLRLQPGPLRADQHARRRLQVGHRLLADLRRGRPDDDQGQVPEGLAADRDEVPELQRAPDLRVDERGVRRSVRHSDLGLLRQHQRLQPGLRGHRTAYRRHQRRAVAARTGLEHQHRVHRRQLRFRAAHRPVPIGLRPQW